MSDAPDDDEILLRKMQMAADIANKQADTALKDEQRRWEPWKALSAAFGAGVAVATGLFTLAFWVVAHFR
jgi:hypothetical protein